MCIAEQVIVNHGEFYCSSGCESWCAILSQWFWIMLCYACEYNGLYCASGCGFDMLCQLLWVMVSYIVPRVGIMICNAEPVVVNHVVLCCGSGCESWWVIMSQLVLIMVCYFEAVIVNHGVLCWANGYLSWCAMLSQWLWIMVCYPEPVVVNHGVLCWASGCE
jgi:hypothetical protein